MTRGDAEELVGRLLSRGREGADDLLKQLDPLVNRATKTAKRARDRADQPLARADRVRRKAKLPGFPITAYDQLSVPQINNRLRELTPEQLRRVLEYESGNRNRIGVMRAVERKLERAEQSD